MFERKTRDTRRSFLRYDLQTLDDSRHHHVLQTRIQTLRVFTHDDEIEFGVTTRHVRQRPHRAQVSVQIQRLPQPDVDRSESLAYRSRDRTLERDFVSEYRIKQLLRQCLAEFLERLRARVMSFPLNLDAGRFDDSDYV